MTMLRWVTVTRKRKFSNDGDASTSRTGGDADQTSRSNQISFEAKKDEEGSETQIFEKEGNTEDPKTPDTDQKRSRPAEPEIPTAEDSSKKFQQNHDNHSNSAGAPPIQKLGSKKLKFQPHCIQKYPWISPTSQGVLCKVCVEVFDKGKSRLNMNWDKSFVSQGYTNWKNALENFQRHATSKSHMFAVSHKVHTSSSETIEARLSSQALAEQQRTRRCYLKVIAALQFCARQGLAIRGHDEKEGNFRQMLDLLASHDPELTTWLEKRNNWCSPQIQNEVLDIMSISVLRTIGKDALDSCCFAVIVDGTQDISGVDQHSLCIRFVDGDLNPREEFLGLYALTSTTGESIAKMIEDVLCRFELPLDMLRGQTYDGAPNMAGQYNGAQTLIRQKQPLALYVHCAAHASNLASTAVAKCSPLVCSAMDAVNELGVLLSTSGKFKATLKDIAAASNAPTTAIKPLCPTRWLARISPVAAILSRYAEVLSALDEIKGNNPVAYGLSDRLRHGNIVLGVLMTTKVFTPLENLNRSLQGKHQTVSRAREAANRVKQALIDLRSGSNFDELFEEVTCFIEEKDLEPVMLPRRKRPPKRLTGDADAFHHQDAKNHNKVEFYEMIDTAVTQLNSRFFQQGMEIYTHLERILLNESTDFSALKGYREIDVGMLKVQLAMFHSQRSCSTLAEAVAVLRGMTPEVRNLFNEVERLVRLLLTIPASSCEAERSFSALRRLKTYLSNTIGQQRLNSLSVCHVHKFLLDKLNRVDILKRFIEGNDSRVNVFGKVLN